MKGITIMIIYNQDKLPIKYVIDDKLVFDITSDSRLEDILQQLRDGKKPSEINGISGFYISENEINKTDNKLLDIGTSTYKERTEDSFIPDYNVVHDDEYEGDVDEGDEFHAEHFQPNSNEPFMNSIETKLFNDYQNFSFNVDSKMNVKGLSLDSKEARNSLMTQIACTLGIMPNLLENYKEATVLELKKMSALGDITFDSNLFDFYANEYPEILPNKNTIEVLKTLSAPERQNFDYIMCPTKIADICVKLKGQSKNLYLTRDLIDAYLYKHIEGIDEFKVNFHSKNNLFIPGLIEETKKEFEQSEYHRSPRVIDDYVLAQYEKRTGRNKGQLAKDIVKDFNFQSLRKIAGTKSLVLYALCDELNMNEVKQSHIDIIASLYPLGCIKNLSNNNFIEFYKAHNNMTDEQLRTLLEGYNYTLNLAKLSETDHYIDDFDISDVEFLSDKSIEENIQYIKEFKGKSDCKEMEYKYGYKFENNDLCIKGRNIEIIDGDLHMYTLQANDYRNFTVGIDTHCCQAYTGAGETCVWKLTTEPYAGVVVIEKKGQILAQGFVWTDEAKDTIVFDNVEFADDRKVHTFNKIFSAWAKECPYANVHVGTSYNENMQGWGISIPQNKRAVMPTTLSSNYVYSDYIGHSNPRAIKKDGRVTLAAYNNYRKIEHNLIPSKYDVINDAGLGYLLSLGFTASKAIEIGNKLTNNELSDEEIKDLIKNSSHHKELLEHLDVMSDDLQMWFASEYPNEKEYIKEPCERLALLELRTKPELIKNIPNPSEEAQILALSQNGLLYSYISNPTYEAAKAAVNNNGYAITLIDDNFKTDELIEIALRTAPRLVLTLNNISDNILNTAINSDPDIIGLLQAKREIPEHIQLNVVENNPTAILNLRNPSENVILKAVEKNGLLLRNFPRANFEIRQAAIQQNPIAISFIKPTLEECKTALILDRNIEDKIKDKDLVEQAKQELGIDTHNENNLDYEEDITDLFDLD